MASAERKLPFGIFLRAIPIGGWLFIFFGLVWPIQSTVLRAVWLIDIFLSVVVHGLQLFSSVPRGQRAGYSTAITVLYTFLFGATWWKSLDPRPPRP